LVLPEPLVINIDGTGRMTRSGRVFAPESPLENIMVVVPPKRKVAPNNDVGIETSKANGPQDKLDEFLRIIKSDYKVVDQLSQASSKISMLSLLINLKLIGQPC
jgi:hypothetical protein